MAKILRDGKEVDDTSNPVALAYYQREDGYEVVDETASASAAKPATLEKLPAPPAPSS